MLPLWWLLTAVTVTASFCPGGSVDNLVAFGDSYTDEGRKAYFQTHSGEAPPAGKLLPASESTSTGGFTWGRLVAKQLNLTYYNYGVGGATCSNDIVKRQNPTLNAPFQAVLDYEVPAYEADIEFDDLYPNRHPGNTVYALWIGTNDLGYKGFLSDDQAKNASLSTYVDCNWEVFDRVYATGGRRFVLINVVPLDTTPTYAVGTGNSQFWPNHKDADQHRYEDKMRQQVMEVNTMFDTGAHFNVLIRRRWPGASLTVFDVHSLVKDIQHSPALYLDKPANDTGSFRRCVPGKACEYSKNKKSSFLWYDELHPSERTSQIVAENFIDALDGKSKYGKCYRSSAVLDILDGQSKSRSKRNSRRQGLV